MGALTYFVAPGKGECLATPAQLVIPNEWSLRGGLVDRRVMRDVNKGDNDGTRPGGASID